MSTQPSLIEIDYLPQPFQWKFHTSSSRFKIIAGGRRVGKSFSMIQECIQKCLAGKSRNVWWVSPTLTDAREVGWEALKSQLPELETAIKYMNETRMICGFSNGSQLMFKSAEKERSLRGRGLDHVAVDEAAYILREIWTKALRPALSDRKGTGTLGSTANGRNWFWEQYKSAKKQKEVQKRKTWDYFHWPTTISTLIDPEEIEAARNELSDIDFRQEYLAEFITRAGMVYEDFSEENIIPSFSLEDYHDIYLGADFGFANPTAICFMAVDIRDDTVTQFDEIYIERKSIVEIADMIDETLRKNGIPKWRVKAIFTDPAGNAEELTSGISPVDYLRMERDWRVENKGSLIVYGLHLVRSFIRSASGHRKFFVLNKCFNTTKSLMGYSYAIQRITDLVKEEPLKDGVHDHMCDAIRYFFVNRFDKAKWVSKEADIHDYRGLGKPSQIHIKKCSQCRRPFSSRGGRNQPPFMCLECRKIKERT
jgi:phage terminase large subunit